MLRFAKDLDHGLESGEDAILAAASEEYAQAGDAGRGALLHRVADDLVRYLDAQIAFEDLMERLQPWLEPREFQPGETLAERGEVQSGAHFLVAGEASIHDSTGRRVHQCGPGDVIEPWAALSDHVASFTAVARTPCRTMMLEPAAMGMLQNDDRELAPELFAYLTKNRWTPKEI